MRILSQLSLMIMMLLAMSCVAVSQGRGGAITTGKLTGDRSELNEGQTDLPIASGNVSGYVFNYYGIAISGATIGVENGPVTSSGAYGYYFLEGVIAGEQEIGCGKAGYNPSWVVVNVVSGDTAIQDFTLTQPAMVINPLFIEETINPGEYLTISLNVLNNGTGPLNWESEINYLTAPVVPGISSMDTYDSNTGGEWLTMDYDEGTVPPFGGVDNIPAHLNAIGTSSGEVYHAEIVFTSTPFVGEITVPVTMFVQGNDILPPVNLTVMLIDAIAGKVELNWDWNGDSFQFFLIRRDGVLIATTSAQSYVDILPDYGLYCYTVQAVYDEGITSPAGPECVEWPNPVLHVNPDDLQSSVWAGYTVDVFSNISNLGEGTLAYSFPEFAALDLLNDPGIEKNQTGSPPVEQVAGISKGDQRYNGTGYPVVLGAGGPDDYGYIWIDSDEDGGPIYNFTDISTTGNPVYGLADDNIVGPYEIGFDFYFYSEIKTQFWVNSNGCVGFTSNKITLSNTSIPTNSSVYNDFIGWMWDDLYFNTGSSQVFYQTFPDKLIIQFKKYEQYGQANQFIDAEMIICVNGNVLLMYDNFAPDIILNSCTVGMQSSDPAIGLQVAFNTAYLHNDLAVLFNLPADFIIDVQPSHGTVPEAGSQLITITYDSKDYPPGPYTQKLYLESNDLDNEEYVIDNTMHVYLPAIYSGIVFDNDNDDALNGVLVAAGPFQTTTGEDGEYILYVDEGSYDVIFEKLGYVPVTVEDTTALQGLVTPISIGMWDLNYAPGFVLAEVLNDDTLLHITWSLPDGPYEIIMDDGEADDFFVYAHAGSWNAVKFTPSGYPATVIGGAFYVGDGSFPGPFLGTEFGVAVFDDDGVNGMPGTMLDSNGVTVNNSGWVSLDWLNAAIYDGGFYLAMYQSGSAPFAAPIGIDTDNPTHFMSFSKFLDNEWILSPLQDFMIRAWVNGPEGDAITDAPEKVWCAVPKVPANWKKYAMTQSGELSNILPGFKNDHVTCRGIESMSNRDVVNYRVARYSDFDPDGPPTAGTLTELATTANLYYDDPGFGAWGAGWYAFGVKALYTSGVYSDYTISNIVGHGLDYSVSVNTSLTSGLEPVNVEVTLQGLEYPYETYFGVTPASGSIVFDLVWKGHYNISIYKIGYDTYFIENTYINADKVYNIILSEKKYPPACLVVDPLTLIATWCEPLRTALEEGFEEVLFPPANWQANSHGEGWFRTTDGSSPNWGIPVWDSFYGCTNDDAAGSENDGCCDYLVTPILDLRESDGYALTFNSFYNGYYGQLAFVEYSTDGGDSWDVLYQLMPDTAWTKEELDLASFSGQAGPARFCLAFHADDAGEYASGWAVDNMLIQVPAPAANYLDFWVFLDNAYKGTTTETSWDISPLMYGQTYTASVAARYSSGLSAEDYYTFESTYLFPPIHLAGMAPDDAVILSWDPPAIGLPFNLLGYNIYRDDVFIDYIQHAGGWVPQGYVEENMQPGIYSYTVSGVYDLTPYGYPGESGESMRVGPEIVTVDYCYGLEFLETWEMGVFEGNNWISDGANWAINGRTGNPTPSAEFKWDPVQTNYEISLESYPLCAVGMTEGKMWLDFDLALYSVQPTGEEMLLVQVWNWQAQVWNTVADYSNIDGSFDWMQNHIDIKAIAMNGIFKVRFCAVGVHSYDIRGWWVDNVHVYRTCDAPADLQVDPFADDGIRLSWLLSDNSGIEQAARSENDLRELVNFQVYRNENGGEYELIGTTSEMEYIDPNSGLIFGSMYCYMVNALWESTTDQCESEFSDEVCILFTDISGNHDDPAGNFSLYPNPANGHVIITSSASLNRITVYNSSGAQLFDRLITGHQYEFKTSAYSAGIYLVLMETNNGVAMRKLTIQR